MEPEPFLEHIASDEPPGIVEAVGKASEAFEYIERARGHLYSFHQLVGRADLLFGEAAEMLAAAGQAEQAATLERDVVGRNVLDGRWTFQVVDEFDDLYYDGVRSALRSLEDRYQDGRRHVLEARLKEQRRTHGRSGHEHRPPSSHSPRVETDATEG